MASKTVKGLIVQIDGDTKGLSKALTSVERQTKNLTDELKDVNKLLKFDPSNVEGLTQKKKLLADTIESCAEKMKILATAQERYQEKIGEGNEDEHMRALKREIEITANKMSEYQRELDGVSTALNRLENNSEDAEHEIDELGDEAEEASHDVDELGDEADEASRDVDDLGDEADEAEDEISALARAAEKAGDGFTVFKGVLSNLLSEVLQELAECLKELGKYALETGMDFESGMSRVVAISGASGDEIDRLTEKAKEMGAKTKFSAGESAEAFGFLAQAGWDTQQMIEGIDGVMNLAAADNIDLANASTIVADALTAMGYKAGDAAKFADVLATASAASNTNVEMMGESFKYAAPLAGVLGYTMEDVAVALGLMANSGIKAETAGTSLRSLFTNLAKPSDQCAEAMEKYGISLTDANGNAKPLNQLLTELRTTFSGLSESEQTALASTLAHKTGMSGLLAIMNSSEEDFTKMTAAMDNSTGAAERMATTMQDNLAGDVEKLGGAFDTLAINLTEKFNGAMREGAQAITAFLDGEISMTEMLSRLSGAVMQAFEVFKSYLPQLGQMGMELITWLVNGIVTGIPTLINKATELVLSFSQGIMNNMPSIVDTASQLLTGFVDSIITAVPKLIVAAAGIVQSLANGITENASNFVSKGLDLLDKFADYLTVSLPILINSGMDFIKNLVKGLMQALPEFIARAPEIISKFANLINDNFPKILAKGVGIVWELIKGIIKAIPTLIANIPKIIKAIVDVITAFNWVNLGKTILKGIGNGIKAMWEWLKGIGKKTTQILPDLLKALPGKLLELGKNAVTWLGNAIKNGWPTIKAGASNLLSSIVNFFKTLPSKMLDVGKNLVKGLWNGIKDMTSWVIGKIKGFGESVLEGIKNFFGIKSPSREFAKIGMFLDQGLAKGLLDNMNDPIKAAQEMAEGVLGEAQGMNGFAIENNLRQRSVQMAADVTAKADNTMLGKLDKILTAIEAGQVITLDGKQLVGGTVTAYDNALGQRRMLAARGAI